MSYAAPTKMARRQSTAAASSPLNQDGPNATHERLTTTAYDDQNGASAATIKRKAPPNTANSSANNRELDLASEMPFPTQPPNRSAAGPLAMLRSEDRLAFGRETPPSQRRSPSPPFLASQKAPQQPSAAPYSHTTTSSTSNTPQGSPTNKNPLFTTQMRSSQQQPSPPALAHSQSYRDVASAAPSSMPLRPLLATSVSRDSYQQQRDSPPSLSQPPFSEDEDSEDGIDVYIGKPSPLSHQSNNGNDGGSYLHPLYPSIGNNKGSTISNPNMSTNQSMIDILHVPPLPDTSDDLDSSSPSSSTPPAAPPAPPPPFGINSSNSYTMSGPRRQFFTQQTSRPLSPLRHESFPVTSAGSGENNNNGNLVDPDTVVLPAQNSPGSKGRPVSGSGVSNIRAASSGQNPGERKLPTPPTGNKTAGSSPTAPAVAPNVNPAPGAQFTQGSRVPLTTSSSPSSPPRIHGIQETTVPDNTGAGSAAQRKGVLGPRASNTTGSSPAEGPSNPARHGTSGMTSSMQTASGHQPPDRSLPLREDDWNNRNSGGAGVPAALPTQRGGSRHVSPSPPLSAPTQQQQQPRSVTPTQQQTSPRIARRPMQYSPERLHAPRAVPLIDIDEFDQRHQHYSREAAAAYIARAPSALSMGYGVPGLTMPAGYFYQQYYQPPMYNEFVNVPDFAHYYQSEEDPATARDGDGAGKAGDLRGRQGRGSSPTPSSTLIHGLNLPGEDLAAKPQQSTSQQQQQQEQQKTQAQQDDRQRKRRSGSQPRVATNAPNNNGALPAYEDYRKALGEDRPQEREQPSQEKRAQQQGDGGVRKEVEEEPAHNTSRRVQAQDPLPSKKEALTRANVRANAGLPPHGNDLYDTYDPVQVQHAMWFLDQQRQRVLYAPHPQPLPAAFLDEYAPRRFAEEDAKHPIVEENNGRHPRQRQTEQPQQRQDDRQLQQRQDTRRAQSGNGQPDRPPSATSSHMYNNVRRPDAPIPPTPQSSTFFSSVAPTPYPLVFSPGPAPPLPASAIAATPAPGPQFASIVSRRGRDFVEPALPTSTTAAAPPSPMQMQRYYPGGPRYYTAQPPSIPSTAMSSPFVGPINPFIRSQPHLQADRESVVSSPSHHPLPLFPRRVKKGRKANGTPPATHGTAVTTGTIPTQRGPREPPARVASTLPPSSDTDLLNDDDDDGDLTEGRDERLHDRSVPPLNRFTLAAALASQQGRSSADDDEESDLWHEEDDDSRLELELHPGYISNSSKRNRRFQDKLDEMIQVFNEMDHATDATMLLFISQPDASPAATHMLSSRNIRRSPKFTASANAARASFSQISSSRRRTSRKKKLEAELRARQDERMSVTSSTTVAGDMSPTSTSAAAAHDVMRKNLAAIEAMAERAENLGGENALKGALRATLDSLRQMQKISEEREERRRDEAVRQRREAAQLEELLQTALSGTPR